jgi:hypothetical protein
MASDRALDYAVVVGVDKYEHDEIRDLQGPVNDANAFVDWVQAIGIPSNRIKLVVSNGNNPPTHAAINSAFDELLSWTMTGQEKRHWNSTLYIYAAGHGYGSMDSHDDATLLAADARPISWWNVAMTRWADYFKRCGTFGQVVVLMDSCREVKASIPIRDGYWPLTLGYKGDRQVRWLFAFAAGRAQLAREGLINGTFHGYFTHCVMEVLNRGRNGAVTNSGQLSDYVKNRITDWRVEDKPLPVPNFIYNAADPVILPGSIEQEHTVRFIVNAADIGKVARIQFGGTGAFDEVALTQQVVHHLLRAGLYKLQVFNPGTQEFESAKLFEVPSDTDIHVR